SFNDANEEAMLKMAEAVYWGPGKVIEQVTRNPVYWAKNLPAEGEPIWGATGNDNVEVPNVVTARAVRYYFDLSRSLRINPMHKGFHIDQTNFSYSAGIKHYDVYAHAEKKFKDVYVADLNIDWGHSCGGLCGMWFKRNKVVVFDAKGNVLDMFLDAPVNS